MRGFVVGLQVRFWPLTVTVEFRPPPVEDAEPEEEDTEPEQGDDDMRVTSLVYEPDPELEGCWANRTHMGFG